MQVQEVGEFAVRLCRGEPGRRRCRRGAEGCLLFRQAVGNGPRGGPAGCDRAGYGLPEQEPAGGREGGEGQAVSGGVRQEVRCPETMVGKPGCTLIDVESVEFIYPVEVRHEQDFAAVRTQLLDFDWLRWQQDAESVSYVI